MDIDKYAKKTTDSNYPIQAKVVRNYIKSVLNSNNVVAVKKATEFLMKPTVGRETRFTFIRALDSDVALFQDINSIAIIAYSLKKKDKVLFEMIQDLYFPNGALLESNGMNFAENVADRTDVNGAITDSWFTTDWDMSVIVYMFLGLYCWNSEMKSQLKNLMGIDVPTSTEFEDIFNKAKRLVSITKPMRVDCGFLQVPTIFLAKQGSTINCYGLSGVSITSANFPSTLSNTSFNKVTINGINVDIWKSDNSELNSTESRKCVRTFMTHLSNNESIKGIEIKNGNSIVANGELSVFKKQTSSITYCIRLYVYIG